MIVRINRAAQATIRTFGFSHWITPGARGVERREPVDSADESPCASATSGRWLFAQSRKSAQSAMSARGKNADGQPTGSELGK
jgi:hypothetical protein